MKPLPTLRQMQYLQTLFETKNFRRAAEICFVTQPTLSAGIKEMESILGAPVLDRSRRKTVLFSALGLEVVETANQILPLLDKMMERATRLGEPLSGPLRLGLIPTIAPYLLPKILPRLQKAFPKIDFQIVEGMSAALLDKLHDGQIDIALMAFPYETKNLNQTLFFEEPFYCAAPRDLFKKTAKISLKDLDKHKLLLLEDGHCLRDHALSACKLQNIEDKKTLSATSLPTILQMVAQGYGITLIPEMMIGQGVIPKGVTLHGFKKPLPSRKIGAAWRQKDPQENDLSVIMSTMKEILIK